MKGRYLDPEKKFEGKNTSDKNLALTKESPLLSHTAVNQDPVYAIKSKKLIYQLAKPKNQKLFQMNKKRVSSLQTDRDVCPLFYTS